VKYALREPFKNQVCVITGAASGIGLALAQQLLDSGARVVFADFDASALAGLSEKLEIYSPRFSLETVDVTQVNQVTNLMKRALEEFGRIDYLFNNAGIGGTLPITEAKTMHWERIINVNLWGVIHGVQAVLPMMLHQGKGHIINTASIAGLIPVPGQALYNTTKYAIVGFSESLRLELQPKGIRVSVICPGPVASRIWGTPIIGERVDRPSPTNAISAREAAEVILTRVVQADGIVTLPNREHRNWLLYRWWPTLVERQLQVMIRP
jgi:NAD(P)-dependent dehydrogenase (short-subunit alcohol dehydrogenase family)